MPVNDDRYEETVELVRPDLSTIAFARRLDLEVIHRPDSGAVVFRRSRSSDRSVEECLESLNACQAQVAAVREALFLVLIGAFDAHKIPLSAVLPAQQAIDAVAIRLLEQCRCSKGPPVPDHNPLDLADLKMAYIAIFAMFIIVTLLLIPEIAGAAAAVATAEAVAGGASAAVAATAGAAAASAVTLEMSITAGVAATVGAVITGILDTIMSNQSNPDFDSVPKVEKFDLPDVDLSILPDALRKTLTQLLVRAGECIAPGQGLVAALEKFKGAVEAGDDDAQTRQLAAAADFADMFADSLEVQVAARTPLVAALRSAGFVASVTPDHVLEAVLEGLPAGPPDLFRQVASHYGVSDVDGLWLRGFSNPMSAVGIFPESLNPPAVAAGEVKVANFLRTSAAKWRA